MERKYAVVAFGEYNQFSHIECVCDSLIDADNRCSQLEEERMDYCYMVVPTFEVKEGEE